MNRTSSPASRAFAVAALSLTLGACAIFGSRSPFAFGEKGELVDFNYAWSAEASASAPLVRRLRADLERSFRATTVIAERDRATATAANRPFSGHRYDRRWTTAGQSARLLSLEGQVHATGSDGKVRFATSALLWDRRARRELASSGLSATPGALEQALTPLFCATFAGERAERRERAPMACPALANVVMLPTDSNGDRRFDRIRLIVSNPASDKEADDRFDIAVPMTPAIRAAIAAPYRASFA